ncbi:Reverse transcriptase [Phytophthora palmivora]|uniref:Reverse transcriptase n=1 Tax=Phytophthora palmivora TaxID=4796 RepID=A0A2P4XIY3_9STRA|nr:Reverse transcriptase [Phytophthora palmivora]
MLDNCLWGFVRLSPAEEAEVDADVLVFLQLKPQDSENQSSDFENQALKSEMSALTSQMTIFQRNIPVPTYMGPVLGRSSYIDDIAHGAPTWDQLCDDLNALLFRLRYWNISVSLSEFGKLSIPYLSHEISAEGLRATPKIVKGVEDLPFPSTLKGVQSFMGSVNYYNKFIEDLPVIAASLYELTDEQIRSGRDLACAKEAFELLKRKIVSTPFIRHPDRTRPFVIIPHANPWAASAVLGQKYDGVIHPVRFTGRVLNDAELSSEYTDPPDDDDERETLGPLEFQAERWRRIKAHQGHDPYLVELMKFLKGNQEDVRETEFKFYWLGMYADVERFVKKCVDCASGKRRPPNPGPSPGNIEPSRPFEVVSMDFVTHMPKSARYVMCKPMSVTTAQDVAEAYEERVFRNFGASSLIRHDQDPRFMSEVFKCFRELLGSRQRATLGYRPQANGQQERSVQTVVRAIKAYISEADQSDWDDHAERLMFALNTSFDATRLEMPFYLVHGWDARGTVSAMLGPKPSTTQERTAYEWRRKMQRDYSYAVACAEDLQKKAKRDRSEEQTRK